MSKNSATEEDDVFEFLNSLPEEKISNSTTSATEGKATDPNEDILDFLDEIEASDKKPTTQTQKKMEEVVVASSQEEDATPSESSTNSEPARQQVEQKPFNPPVADPITSISNWWSKDGSAKVSSQISSFWGAAQSLSEQAQKQAEHAIKLAKDQKIEDNLKNAFKDIGITGVLEGERDLTEDEKSKLMKLPDTKHAVESLNKGFSMFSTQLSNVIEKFQQDLEAGRDEVLEIRLVHDLRNYKNLTRYVKDNFEQVMRSQVDGDIQVNITESGTVSSDSMKSATDRNLGLFSGKISDGEKLINANIESVIKSESEVETENSPKIRRSQIYIGLLATSVNSHSNPDKDITQEESSTITIDEYQSTSFSFTAILIDKTHDITIINRSQPFPLRWCQWLDGKIEGTGHEDEDVDPSEWVVNWVNKGLDMMFGVLAQAYIIKRMGY
ncbi:hypothetical protein CANARDRAFT_5862 [[Candida] arabinofermentans NRRL YB-2248]|uniref:Maintenance of telomere capping protein 1 n=1 Tax=[Candida] arabinofermentans NRRL YB-2248 TaxID=983967 RepID=A0A1E4T6C9_9ASCO|nr:hypothetical protein CANARDRAFT_5862 [[Candida] arabinofermentans NRRL YB-2248]